MESAMAMPEIFDYAEYRKFLTDWFDAKKTDNPRLSLRWFARQLGTKDPSALLNVLSGRRGLGGDRIEGYVRVLELEGSRADYFRALVAFEDAPDEASATHAWARLADLRSREAGPDIGLDAFEFLSCWYIPAVRELAHNANFQEDPAWIAGCLDPRITEEEAARALRVCVALGYLVRSGDRLVPSEPALRTPPGIHRLASWPYHRDGLVLAERGLHRLRAGADRDFIDGTLFLGATFAVPASRMKEVRVALFEILSRTGSMVDAWASDADRVVQVSISMVPVGRMDGGPTAH